MRCLEWIKRDNEDAQDAHDADAWMTSCLLKALVPFGTPDELIPTLLRAANDIGMSENIISELKRLGEGSKS